MQLRARLESNAEHAIVAEATRAERYVQTAYDEALQGTLSPDARKLVEAQLLGVRVAGRLVADLTIG
jgi:uncharacterized protein (TIGR02284 family)